MREYEIYRCVYCGLCKELGRSFGPFARLTLTYDAAFLSLLELALSEKAPAFTDGRCLLKPLAKRKFLLPNSSSVSAVTGLLLLHYKVLDSLKDFGFMEKLRGLLLLPFTWFFRRGCLKNYSHIDESIRTSVEALASLEKNNSPSIDSAAETFACLISKIAQTLDSGGSQIEPLSRLGYHLGRWIYVFDALEDMEDDLKKGNYNPILCYYEIAGSEMLEKFRQTIFSDISQTLALSLSAAHQASRELTFYRFRPIIDNILAQGMPSRVRALISDKGETAYD